MISQTEPDYQNLTPAAVLIALFPKENTWYFPLIRRVVDGFAHSGQIALPGGRIETGETVEGAALREAEEEVGLVRPGVEVLGKLSPLPIPVSGYLVNPVVGVMQSEPRWRPQPGEVADIFTASVQDLMDESNRTTEMRHFRDKRYTVPYFNFKPHKVWGATAMIIAEFELVVQGILNQD
ncbi:MAG: CoA pyrophosphatase [Candidatus Marinimicrobia bacterium]|nr:CoA pyrophosphatase [Candidatus Neomarinimicrobiota bacterium]MCF7840552.1 CoA pyrophosphatase [Candidatus Neomarinimicrobiota bacterium]